MRKTLLALLAVVATLRVDAGQSVTLAWNPNREENLTGYRLYCGNASRDYVTFSVVLVPSTTITIENLFPGVQYFFAVTAFIQDGAGNILESDYSDEVCYTPPVPHEDLPSPPPIHLGFEKQLVSWPVTEGFSETLETSTDLSCWLPVAPPQRRDNRWVVPFPLSTAEPARFFRLKRIRSQAP